MKRTLGALAALTLALALTGCQKADDAAFGERVRTYLLAHPEVLEQMAQKLQEQKALAANKQTLEAIRKNRAALVADSRDFVANPGGKITVVEFFDYRCGYCKVSAPEILKIIEDNPDIRFVFKELPIFGGASNLAAKVALSPQGKAKGLEIYRAFMTDKALDEAAIARHLAAVGVDPMAAAAAGDSAEVQKHLADTHALAGALKIEGTPAFIVGDHLIPGADLDALRTAIAEVKLGQLKAPT